MRRLVNTFDSAHGAEKVLDYADFDKQSREFKSSKFLVTSIIKIDFSSKNEGFCGYQKEIRTQRIKIHLLNSLWFRRILVDRCSRGEGGGGSLCRWRVRSYDCGSFGLISCFPPTPQGPRGPGSSRANVWTFVGGAPFGRFFGSRFSTQISMRFCIDFGSQIDPKMGPKSLKNLMIFLTVRRECFFQVSSCFFLLFFHRLLECAPSFFIGKYKVF